MPRRLPPPPSRPQVPSVVAALRTGLALVGCLLALGGLTGCATPGINHLYVAPAHGGPIITDLGPVSPPDPDFAPHAIPSFLRGHDLLLGLAYDGFTDHLYLRLTPGNRVRTVDRPGRRFIREWTLPELPVGAGDLTIRSRDRRLFLTHPHTPVLLEVGLHGALVRTIPLQNLNAPANGVAYDQRRNQLLVLRTGDLASISRHALDGRHLSGVALDRDIRPGALAYDSVAEEFYVALDGEGALGVFGPDGQLRRTLPLPPGHPLPRFDLGPRSLIRLF